MMRYLLSRTLYEKRWFIAGWGVAFGVMSTLIMMFYPSFSQGGGFEDVAKTLPTQLQGFIGNPAIFGTVPGFITSQVYDVRMSLFIIIMTLVLAVSLTVREEETGELRTTLMTSLGRTRLLIEKFVAAAIIIVILNMIAVLGIFIGLLSIGETAPNELIAKLFALSCLFGFTAFAIPFSVGLATGRRSITMTIGLVIAIGSYLLSTFARAVDWLKDWEHVSLIHYYDTTGIRENDFHMFNVWVFLLIIGFMLSLAFIGFRRRDI